MRALPPENSTDENHNKTLPMRAFHKLLQLQEVGFLEEGWLGTEQVDMVFNSYHLRAIAAILESLPTEQAMTFLHMLEGEYGRKTLADFMDQPYHPPPVHERVVDVDGHGRTGSRDPGHAAAVGAIMRTLRRMGFGREDADGTSQEIYGFPHGPHGRRNVDGVMLARSPFYSVVADSLSEIECPALEHFKKLFGGKNYTSEKKPKTHLPDLHVPLPMDLNRTTCVHEVSFRIHKDDWQGFVTDDLSLEEAGKEAHTEWRDDRNHELVLGHFPFGDSDADEYAEGGGEEGGEEEEGEGEEEEEEGDHEEGHDGDAGDHEEGEDHDGDGDGEEEQHDGDGDGEEEHHDGDGDGEEEQHDGDDDGEEEHDGDGEAEGDEEGEGGRKRAKRATRRAEEGEDEPEEGEDDAEYAEQFEL